MGYACNMNSESRNAIISSYQTVSGTNANSSQSRKMPTTGSRLNNVPSLMSRSGTRNSHNAESGQPLPSSMLTRKRLQALSETAHQTPRMPSLSEAVNMSHSMYNMYSSLQPSAALSGNKAPLSLIRNSDEHSSRSQGLASNLISNIGSSGHIPSMPQLRPGASLIGNLSSARSSMLNLNGKRPAAASSSNTSTSNPSRHGQSTRKNSTSGSTSQPQGSMRLTGASGYSNMTGTYPSGMGMSMSSLWKQSQALTNSAYQPHPNHQPLGLGMSAFSSLSNGNSVASNPHCNRSISALQSQHKSAALPPPFNKDHALTLPDEYPDVTPSDLPFCDILNRVMRPTSLLPRSRYRSQEQSISFHLSAEQAEEIGLNRNMNCATGRTEYAVQLQLRCLRISGPSPHTDAFPPGISLRVNRTPATLPPTLPTNKPNSDPIRPGRPVNISAQCRISGAFNNSIHCTWSNDYQHHYCILVDLVRMVTPKELSERLRKKSVRSPEFTKTLIRQKLSPEDGEVAVTHLHASLRCPLTKTRLQTPVRSNQCSHLQCFDLTSYLAMNERKPTWKCPFCDCLAEFKSLYIDSFFEQILQTAAVTTDNVQFKEDGSWEPVTDDLIPDVPGSITSPVIPEDSAPVITSCTGSGEGEDVVDLTCSDDEEAPSAVKRKGSGDHSSSGKQSPQRPDIIQHNSEIITLDSSDDEADNPPKKKKPRVHLSSSHLIAELPAFNEQSYYDYTN